MENSRVNYTGQVNSGRAESVPAVSLHRASRVGDLWCKTPMPEPTGRGGIVGDRPVVGGRTSRSTRGGDEPVVGHKLAHVFNPSPIPAHGMAPPPGWGSARAILTTIARGTVNPPTTIADLSSAKSHSGLDTVLRFVPRGQPFGFENHRVASPFLPSSRYTTT